MIPLPQLTPEGYRVTLYKLGNVKETYHPHNLVMNLFNLIEIRLVEEQMYADVLIIDMQGAKMRLSLKTNPVFCSKASTIHQVKSCWENLGVLIGQRQCRWPINTPGMTILNA